MLKLLLKAGLALAVVAALYVASPFRAAWAIREAVTRGDTAHLARSVHWPRVRETMRQSMMSTALDLPDPDALEMTTASATAPSAGMWARFKRSVKLFASRHVVDKMVDGYINADGLPKLYRARQAQGRMLGAAGDSDDPFERFGQVWSRIRRAEFRDLTTFAIEIEDQFDATQRYAAVLELRGDAWILTGLGIKTANKTLPVADAR
jgi:hypothetical protein